MRAMGKSPSLSIVAVIIQPFARDIMQVETWTVIVVAVVAAIAEMWAGFPF